MEQISPLLKAHIEQQQALEQTNNNINNNTYYADLTSKPDTFKLSTKKEEASNKKGKIAKIIAAGMALTAVTAGVIYTVKKGKTIKLKNMTPDRFKQIQADKFTGKIKGKLKNGDKIVMEYTDGVLKKSARKGSVNFEKAYETINNEKIVKKTVNGITTEFNITKTQKEVKEAQNKLKSIFDNKNLSSLEFREQTDAIKFKSHNQQKEIEDTIITKRKAEAEAKAKAEAELKAKAEAQAKAVQKAKEEAARTNLIDLSTIERNEQNRAIGYTTKSRYEKIVKQSSSKIDFAEEEKYLEKLKSVSVDESSKLGDYTSAPYDMPLKFMASTNEKFVKEGSALIVDEIPEMFKGIEQSELSDAIDKLGTCLDSKKLNRFEIGGKTFTAEYKGSGIIGRVYKISDEEGRSVAVKYFKNARLTGLQGAYAEIPIAREASKEGVVDVAKFYMANPCGRYDTIDGFSPNQNVGGWHMVEYIEENTPLKNNGKGKKFFEWLKSHGLTFGDFNDGTKKGEYIVDAGGVMHPKNKYDPHFISKRGDFADELLRGYTNNETIDDIIKVISK